MRTYTIDEFVEEWGYTDVELADSMGYGYVGTDDLEDGTFAEYAINCGFRWSQKYKLWFNRTNDCEIIYELVMQEKDEN